MDGNSAARELRPSSARAELPAIALTAGALEAGMSDFLTKPLEPAVLVRTLRRHIERARDSALPVQSLAAAGWPRWTASLPRRSRNACTSTTTTRVRRWADQRSVNSRLLFFSGRSGARTGR